MNEKTIDQMEEEVLSYEVSDEAVEAAGTRTEIAGAWTFVCTGGIQCNHNVSDGGRTGQDSSSILQAGFRLRKNPEQSNALGVVPQVAFDIGSFNRAAGVSGGWGMPRRRPYM